MAIIFSKILGTSPGGVDFKQNERELPPEPLSKETLCNGGQSFIAPIRAEGLI